MRRDLYEATLAPPLTHERLDEIASAPGVSRRHDPKCVSTYELYASCLPGCETDAELRARLVGFARVRSLRMRIVHRGPGRSRWSRRAAEEPRGYHFPAGGRMLIQTNIRELARGMKVVATAMGGKHDAMVIDVRKGELRLVASDGNWIMEWSCERWGADIARVALDGQSLRAMLPALAGFEVSKDETAGLTLTDSVVRLEHGLGAIEMRTTSTSDLPFANKYEDFTRPTEHSPPTAWWAGSTAYMEKVGYAFREVSRGGANLLFRCGGERDPVYITSKEAPNLRVALMPVAIDGRTDFKAPKR